MNIIDLKNDTFLLISCLLLIAFLIIAIVFRKKMPKLMSKNPFITALVVTMIPIGYLAMYNYYDYVHIENWASFATYTSLGLSITTVIFVLMTYQIQSKSSTILQFDSTFFQWMGIFLEAISKDERLFAKYVKSTAISLINRVDESFDGNFCTTDTVTERTCVRHYKVLYQIIRYIHTSEIIPDNEKKKYIDIIQSQLTDEQLLTFFVLLLMDKEKNNERVLGISLIKLMDKYHFFKNLYFSENKESLGKFLCTNFPETKNSFHWFKENIVDNEQR